MRFYLLGILKTSIFILFFIAGRGVGILLRAMR
jgi:hypothetical protein